MSGALWWVILLISLTIFLLLRQNSDLLAFREIQKEQHRLLSDDVGKIDIVYLKFEHKYFQDNYFLRTFFITR